MRDAILTASYLAFAAIAFALCEFAAAYFPVED